MSNSGEMYFASIATPGKVDEKYEVGKLLGKGAFSTVYEARDRETGEKYAIKAVNKVKIKKKLMEREIQIMTKIRHPNILYCREIFETEIFIYLVLELVKGGELYDKIVNEGWYNEEEAKYIILQLLDAVEYLHTQGIAHRDLKPENVLCETRTDPSLSYRLEKIKVADFGLSKMFIDGENLESQCGSPTYVAPEVLTSNAYDEAVDMWALGVVTFVILTGCFPFFDESEKETNYALLYNKILAVQYDFPDDVDLSYEAMDFISRLLVKDPRRRLTPTQCRNHPWLLGYNPPQC